MKNFALRTAFGFCLATLLAACGSGNPADLADQTAAAVQTNVQVASANMPAPDCAADGCKSLRIIDGNAEAARYAAQQRAAAEQGPQS